MFATWCGHCKSLEPSWTSVAQEFVSSNRCKVAHLDAEANKQVADRYGVKGYPTLKFIKPDGTAVDYNQARDVNSIKAFIEEQGCNALDENVRHPTTLSSLRYVEIDVWTCGQRRLDEFPLSTLSPLSSSVLPLLDRTSSLPPPPSPNLSPTRAPVSRITTSKSWRNTSTAPKESSLGSSASLTDSGNSPPRREASPPRNWKN